MELLWLEAFGLYHQSKECFIQPLQGVDKHQHISEANDVLGE